MKLTTKRLLPLLLCAVLALGTLVLPARAVSDVTVRLRPDIAIVIDGSERIFYNVSGQQVHPISYNDTTYLPLRAIGELMGKLVQWDRDTKTASLAGVRTGPATSGTPDANAKSQDVAAELRDDITVTVDGAVQTFTDAKGRTVYPLSYQGSTYLPVRAIGQLMGKSVSWDGKTNTVTLSGSAGSEVTDADVIVGGGTNSGSSTGDNKGFLSMEDAKAKALADAGLTAGQVTFTKEKLDRDGGRQEYEIEFYAGDTEYEYEIDAKTGDILSREVKSGTPKAPGSAAAITREKAQEIALAKVPGANASHIKKLKLDRDAQVYEVEIVYNGMEHDMEIDAVTGSILEYEMDRD